MQWPADDCQKLFRTRTVVEQPIETACLQAASTKRPYAFGARLTLVPFTVLPGPQWFAMPGLGSEGWKPSVYDEQERFTVSVLLQPEILGSTCLGLRVSRKLGTRRGQVPIFVDLPCGSFVVSHRSKTGPRFSCCGRWSRILPIS